MIARWGVAALYLAGGLCLAAGLGHAAPASAQREAPNVVLIVADDLGWGELGAYGQTMIATPHLDRLAARGVRFTDAYAAAPVCAPSRCSMLTGRYATHCSSPENARPNVPLSLETPNVALWLDAEGYETALVGKWGLGGELDEGTRFSTFSLPNAIGFDRFAGVVDQQLAEVAYPFEWWRDDERVANEHGGARRWLAAVLIEEVLAQLDRLERDRPFFLLFTPTLPHREYRVPEIDAAYRDRGWPAVEATYATMVSELDRQVGAIVERLEARGLMGETLLIFTSDNGPSSNDGHTADFFRSAGGLRGEKRDLYEGGIRVPLIIAGPDIGARDEATPVALYDLMPTLAELAGTDATSLDGVSLVPLLSGGSLPREGLLFSGGEAARPSDEDDTRFAVRAGALSLIERRSGIRELYDLSSDPAQAHDLADERPDDVARLAALRARLASPLAATSAPTLAIDGDDDAAPDELTPVLAFSFDEGDPLANLLPRPAARLRLVGGAALHEGRLRLARSSDGAARAHAVLAAHPSHAFGRASFTFAAQIALEPTGGLDPADGSVERATVACARPAGREPRFTDWAVLAHVGTIYDESDDDDHDDDENDDATSAEPIDPRSIGVIFGDPSISGRGRRAAEHASTVPIVSRLQITDGDVHRLEVAYDDARGELHFTLDDETDVVPVERRLHYPSDGPLVLGACLDASGRPEGAMVGSLDDVALARGAGSLLGEDGSVALPFAQPSERTVRVTRVASTEGITERVVVRNPRSDGEAGRVLRLEIDERLVTDRRIAIEPFEPLLLPGQERTIVVRIRAEPGAITEQAFTLIATDALLGTLARGTPLTVHLEGAIEAPPSRIGWIEGGGLAAILLTLGLLALRSRQATRRKTG